MAGGTPGFARLAASLVAGRRRSWLLRSLARHNRGNLMKLNKTKQNNKSAARITWRRHGVPNRQPEPARFRWGTRDWPLEPASSSLERTHSLLDPGPEPQITKNACTILPQSNRRIEVAARAHPGIPERLVLWSAGWFSARLTGQFADLLNS